MSLTNIELHKAKLKEKFKNYETITINDFYEFYTEVFGKINKKTLSWYIYELKENGTIKNISRGLYALTENVDSSQDQYFVITMDIIKSTKNEDYKKFNSRLKNKTNKINEAIMNKFGIHRKYYISQGDELQIIFPMNKKIGEIILLTLSYLYPYTVRYGMSSGKIRGQVLDNSWEMNEPLFWNARDQLDKIKRSDKYEGLFKSGINKIDRLCNIILPLINKTICMITEKQWEAIRENFIEENSDQILKRLKISKTSFYERLKSSNVDEILMAFTAITELIENGVPIR